MLDKKKIIDTYERALHVPYFARLILQRDGETTPSATFIEQVWVEAQLKPETRSDAVSSLLKKLHSQGIQDPHEMSKQVNEFLYFEPTDFDNVVSYMKRLKLAMVKNKNYGNHPMSASSRTTARRRTLSLADRKRYEFSDLP
jgi:hypothetical protein